ncbi:unnamed protein product [Dicrocoelium dendriticum]|nr:unnamed protein product [Dicrocoelium dendriticum]
MEYSVTTSTGVMNICVVVSCLPRACLPEYGTEDSHLESAPTNLHDSKRLFFAYKPYTSCRVDEHSLTGFNFSHKKLGNITLNQLFAFSLVQETVVTVVTLVGHVEWNGHTIDWKQINGTSASEFQALSDKLCQNVQILFQTVMETDSPLLSCTVNVSNNKTDTMFTSLVVVDWAIPDDFTFSNQLRLSAVLYPELAGPHYKEITVSSGE